jgi:DnaJ-class molecular chaperone
MALGCEEITCPECEGVGLALNKFQPPLTEHQMRNRIPFEQYSSQGWCYTSSPCDRCKGNKTILMFYSVAYEK